MIFAKLEAVLVPYTAKLQPNKELSKLSNYRGRLQKIIVIMLTTLRYMKSNINEELSRKLHVSPYQHKIYMTDKQ